MDVLHIGRQITKQLGAVALSVAWLVVAGSPGRAQDQLNLHVKGTVKTADGQPVARAIVRIAGEDQLSEEVLTADDGQYSCPLPPHARPGGSVNVGIYLVNDKSVRQRARVIRTSFSNSEKVVLPGGQDPIEINVTVQIPITDAQLAALAESIRNDPFQSARVVRALMLEAGARRQEVVTRVRKWAALQQDPFTKGCLLLFVSEPVDENRAARCIEQSNSAYESLGVESDVNLAWLHDIKGEFSEAERLLQKALERQPKNGDILDDLGVVLMEEGRYKDTEKLLLQLVDREADLTTSATLDTAAGLVNMASVEQILGRCRQAELFDDWALVIQRELDGPDSRELIIPFNTLSLIYKSIGRFAEATVYNKRASDLWNTKGEPGRIRAGRVRLLTNQGDLYAAAGRYDDAEKSYREALLITQKDRTFEFPESTVVRVGLVGIDLARDENDLARTNADILRRISKEPHPRDLYYAAVLAAVAAVDERDGKYEEAAEFLQNAIEIATIGLGPDHPLVADYSDTLGSVLKRLGRESEAAQLTDRSASIRKQQEEIGCRGDSIIVAPLPKRGP
jgi:tetratricopeptide (TPR) repeat protein